jgi:hypothetical protein
MNNHKLTNKDIADQYSNTSIHVTIDDFAGAFACWATRQDESHSYQLVAKAIEAYVKWVNSLLFTQKKCVLITPKELAEYTSESNFISIPEVFALNQKNDGFVSLGALSRNVYYHIMREKITQPIDAYLEA